MKRWTLILTSLTLSGLTSLAAPGSSQVVNAQGTPPMMMGGDKPSPKTVKLQQKAGKLEAQYKKKPTSQLKMQLAQAKYEYGHARMYDTALSARQKYRPALKAFREALQLNPNHKQAKADKETIEKVYRDMGMPVPQ
jgi:tetratricopeptide (TPR) repeat protein